MKRTKLLFRMILSLFIIGFLGISSLSAQTVNNGDFESWTVGAPDDWTLVANFTTNITFNQSVAGGVTGDALEVVGEAYNMGADGKITNVVEGITEGNYYDLSVMLKSNDDLIKVRMTGLRWLDASDLQIDTDVNDATLNADSGDAWTLFELAQNPIQAPVGAAKLEISIVFYFAVGVDPGVSTMLIDDLTVVDVTAEMDAVQHAIDNTDLTNSTNLIDITYADDAVFSSTIDYATFQPALPIDLLTDALFETDHALDAGAVINIQHTGYGIDQDYVAIGGETSLWLSDMTGAPRLPLVGYTGVSDVWNVTVSGLLGGTYNFTISSIADDNYADTYNRYVLASDVVQINVTSEEEIAIQHGIDNTTLTVDLASQVIMTTETADIATVLTFPTFQAAYPTDLMWDVLFEFSGDALPAGTQIDIVVNTLPFASYVAVGGETELWFLDLDIPDILVRDYLINSTGDVNNVDLQFSNMSVEGTYTVDFSVVVDLETGFTDPLDWTVYAQEQTEIIVSNTPVVSFPVYEDFEDGTLYFDNGTADVNWVPNSTVFFEGTKSYHNAYGANNNNSLELVGAVDISSATNPTLAFNHIARSEDNWDHCYVEVSTDGITWTILPATAYMGTGNYVEPLYNTPEGPCFMPSSYSEWSGTTPDNTWWKRDKFSLADYAGATELYVRFRLKSDGTGQYSGWYIDAISIYDELCPEPTNLLVDNITVDGGDLSWTDGGALWNVEVGLIGFAPGMAEEEAVFTGVIASPFTITGLSDNVDYQVYIQTDCDVDGVSLWSGPFNFTTLPLCPWPVSLAVDEPLSDGAIFSWTAGGMEAEWNLEVGAAGFAPGTGVELFAYNTVVDNPYTAAGMDPETTYEVYVQADCDADGNSVWEGPVSFTTLPSCPEPTNAQLDIAGTDYATVSWDQPGTPALWDLIWDLNGFNPAIEGNLVQDIVTNPHDLTGLTAQTEYDFYVRADCGGGETSAWVGPVTFITACEISAAPYLEDFENAGATPDCWMNFGAEDWMFATTSSGNHCAPNDHTSGTGYFAYVDDSESPHATDVTLETPMIDISTLTNPALYFWVYSDNEGYAGSNMTLRINVWNGTDWDLDVSTWNAQTTGWQQVVVPLNAYLGNGTVKIQFVGDETSSGSNYYDDISIDDIEVKEGPTCPMPISIILSNVLPTSADISWTESGVATEWNLVWGPVGFDPDTEGTLVSGLLTESYSFTGLLSDDSYQVYVQAVCIDLSDWSAPVTINTPCDYAVIPYLEDFEGGTFVPDCWENASGELADPTIIGSTTFWYEDGYGNIGTTGAAKNNVYSTNRFGWLITPLFDLGDGSTPYMLEFDVALTDYASTANPDLNGTDDKFAVVISIDGGLTWSDVNTLRLWDNQGSPYVYNTLKPIGEHVLLDLSAYTGTVKIGFYAESTVSNADNDLFVDNVAVNVLPSCFEPLTISNSNVTETEADLAWTEFVTGTDWELIYGTPGFDPETEGTLVSGVNTNPYTVTGLTAGTTYDVYVRTDCGGDLSVWTGPTNFTTIATCLAPIDLTDSNITGTTVDLTWTETGTAAEWEIIYGPAGFNPFAEGTLITAIATTTYPLTGLTGITDYDIYVRANCGTETSPWSPVLSISTDCEGSMSIPMVESFEAGTGAFKNGDTNGTDWQISTAVVSDGIQCVTNPYAASNTNILYQQCAVDISPAINPVLIFTHMPLLEGDWDHGYVEVSSDGIVWTVFPEASYLGSGIYNPSAYNTPEGPCFDENAYGGLGSATPDNSLWKTEKFSLVDYIGATELYVRFRVKSDGSGQRQGWFLDKVMIFDETCPQPTGFIASFIGGQEVEITWTETGSATEWEVYYGVPGFDPATEGTSEIATASPYTITGLTPETDYEIYVRANCAVGDESFLTGPIALTTDVLCPAPVSTAVYSTGQFQTTVTWSTSGASSWEILYGAAGFDPLTEGTLIDDILAQPYDLTGLTAGTDYDVYVRVDCDANGFSEWDGPASFTTLPSCAIPTALMTADLTSTSVTLTWTENGTATDWTVIYGVEGFDPLTEGTSYGVAGTPSVGLTGLIAATNYDVYLIANCGVGDDSEMGGPSSFATLCGVIDVFPFTQGFESSTFAPTCWVNAQVAGPGAGLWDRQTSGTSPTCTPHSGAAMSRFNAYSYSAGTRGMLVTPPLSFADDNFEVKFWMYRDNGYLTNAEQVNVYYNTTQDLTGAVLLGTVNRSVDLDPVVGANGWYEYAFPVPAGVSGDSYIVFEGVSAYGNNIFIDDVTVQMPPTCPQPNAIVLDANAGYESTISWTETGAAAEWEVIYGAAGFDPLTEGTLVSGVIDNPYTITGLTPETDYDVYVRAYCAIDDQSYWTGPMTWTTDVACPDVIGASLDAADFESLTVLIEVSGTETTWNVLYGLNGFIVGEGTLISVTDNPFTINGLAFETSYDIYIQADCGAVDGTSDFVGPFTYSTTEPCPEVTDIALDYVDYESAEVSWTAGSTEIIWDVIYGVAGFDPLTEGTTVVDVTTPYIIPGLLAETDYDVYVIADCGAVLGESTMAGPFAFTTLPLCSDVTGIMLTAISDVTASIEWTPGFAETLWALEWGEAGFVQGTGTMEVVTTDAMFDFTSLMANTDYDVYIQADCEGALGTAGWVLFEFSTDCETISDFTWIEEFEDWAAVTDCWSLTGGTNEVAQYTTTAVEGSYWDWTAGSTAYLTSPNFDISSLTTPVIEFKWSHQFNVSYLDDALELQVTDDGGATWTQVWAKVGAELDSDDGAISTDPGTYATSGELDLSAFGDNIKFRFYFYSGYGPDVFIDNVTIYEMVCVEPTDLAVDSFDETTATISWTDVAGTGSVNVIYGENGFDPLTEGTTVSAVTDNPYTITALTHNTAYQVYIATDCGIMSSTLVGPIDFTTLAFSMETEILTYTFGALDFQVADIDNVAKTVDIIVVNGTNLTTLVAEFTLSTGATANIGGTNQESTVTVNDFNTPVVYNVVAEDMVTNTDWTINVSVVSEISLAGEGSIVVYPNPNRGEFNISFRNIENAVSYQLYDTKSSIILENEVNPTDSFVEELDLDLQPGVYYLRIISGEKTHIEKLVIE